MKPKRNTDRGVITFHTPFPVSLLKSEEFMADVKDSRKSLSQPTVRSSSDRKGVSSGKRDEASLCVDTKQEQPSHTSLRRLQAKMEAENQQVKEIIQPFLDVENGFMKELESFLSRRQETELRRKELLHKRWTEDVWFPLQSRVEEHVSSCSPVALKWRQSLYRDYLHHCNTKGFVFLETCDLREYNPFLLHIKSAHFFKLSTADFKDPSYFQFHERLREKRAGRSCYGCDYSRRQVEKLPQSDRLLMESVTSQSATPLQTSSHRPVTASRKAPEEDDTRSRRFSRLDTIPNYITATSTPDGRCHQSGCRFSRWGCQQQTASLQTSPTPR